MTALHWMASPSGWRWAKRLGALAATMAMLALIVVDNFVLVELRVATFGVTTRLGWIIATTAVLSYLTGRAGSSR